MIVDYVLVHFFQIFDFRLFLHDIFVEVFDVEFVLNFWLDRRLDRQILDLLPIDIRKPRVLENLLCIFEPDSLGRVFCKALFDEVHQIV